MDQVNGYFNAPVFQRGYLYYKTKIKLALNMKYIYLRCNRNKRGTNTKDIAKKFIKMKIKFNKSGKKICFKSINEYRSTFVKKFRQLVFFDRIEIYIIFSI